MQISSTELQLHKARMLDIRGKYEESVSIYNEVAKGLIEYSKKYPQYTNYYKQYYDMIREELSAMSEMRSRRINTEVQNQAASPSLPVLYMDPPPIPPKPASFSQTSPIENNDYQQPIQDSVMDMRDNPQGPPSNLTNSDILYAARGVGNRMKEFDQQHGVSEKCKQVATACAQKVKTLDQEYELRKKAVEFGHSVKEWDERNGVSKAVINGVKQVACSVGSAVKEFADKVRAEEASQDNPNPTPNYYYQTSTPQGYPGTSSYRF